MRSRRASELRPRKQPSQERSRVTVGVILEAAARVFAAEGYASATTNRIAAKAGVSVGSLYEYFPNKDALLVALMEAHIAEGQEILTAAGSEALRPGLSLRHSVARLVQAMIEFHARDRQLHRVLFEETPLPPRIRRQLAEVEQTIAGYVAAFLRQHPDVTAPDVDLAAMVLVHAIEGLTHRLVVHGDAQSDAAQIEELVTLATAFLTAPRGSAGV